MIAPMESGAALEAEADRAVAARDVDAAARLLERACVIDGDNAERWIKLAMVRRSANDLEGALDAVSAALAMDPLAFLPLLLRHVLLADLGRAEEAGEAAAAALFHAPPDDRLPPHLAVQLARAREAAEAHADRQAGTFGNAAAKARDDGSPAERARIDRFISNAARLTRAFAQQPTHFHFPGLPVIEFFDADRLPWLDVLGQAADEIREEFDNLIAREAAEIVPYIQYQADLPLAQWRQLNHSKRWSAIHLWKNGEVVERNARHCPRTMAIFEGLDQPRVPGRSPNLMFSLLAPQTRIPPHHGVSNTRLVVHLPLVVPPGCGFRVGDETRFWQAGMPFAFDDTIEHEAWNEGSQLRVVLIGDAWRPELSDVERAAASAIMTLSAAPSDGL